MPGRLVPELCTQMLKSFVFLLFFGRVMYEKKVKSSKFFQSENVPSDPECQKFKSFDFKGVKYIPSGRLLVENN